MVFLNATFGYRGGGEQYSLGSIFIFTNSLVPKFTACFVLTKPNNPILVLLFTLDFSLQARPWMGYLKQLTRMVVDNWLYLNPKLTKQSEICIISDLNRFEAWNILFRMVYSLLLAPCH
jgi:hypothetical protein